MNDFRIEKDSLGELKLPVDVLYGIHSLRARINFPLSKRAVRHELIKAYAMVKKSSLCTNHTLGYIDDDVSKVALLACDEIISGMHYSSFITDALQGGAGTSLNMNLNEVIANISLKKMGKCFGEYEFISPLSSINLHQSTNDTYPTALRIAAIFAIRKLEQSIVKMVTSLQSKEQEFSDVVKCGRTELQDAVLTTYGRSFSAYSEAFSRDRWRIYKCEERLRSVNLGGTAIGSGLAAPRKYIFKVVDELKKVTALPLSRGENLEDLTQNADIFIEVSGILKALAGNLIKVANDLRFLSSGPTSAVGEVILPKRQTGSSVMPGKVNPVVLEAVVQSGYSVIANDLAITLSASHGDLELNAFLPLIADKLLESLDLLESSLKIFREFVIEGLVLNRDKIKTNVENSMAVATVFLQDKKYNEIEEALIKDSSNASIKEKLIAAKITNREEYDKKTSSSQVTKLGF